MMMMMMIIQFNSTYFRVDLTAKRLITNKHELKKRKEETDTINTHTNRSQNTFIYVI
jgi:hypothetical protein